MAHNNNYRINSSTQLLSGRIPNELLKIKGEKETQTEFLVRACIALRDKELIMKLPLGNKVEHDLLIKMVKAFAKAKIKMELTPQEIEKIKELYGK